MLHRIDRTQLRFRCEFGCSELRALLQFRLAPVQFRRDISIFGILYRLGLAPPPAAALFPVVGAVVEPHGRQFLMQWRPLHNLQIGSPATFTSTGVLPRAAFGLAGCYDRLPQEIVEIPYAVMNYVESVAVRWQAFFLTHWRLMPADAFHALFRMD